MNIKNHLGTQRRRSRALKSVLRNMCLSTRLYLREAKRSADYCQSKDLEATAVKRALIAQQLNRILGKPDTGNTAQDTSAAQTPSLVEIDRAINRDCLRLYRNCNDTKTRQFVREIITNLNGLALHAGRPICP